jgi:hypothetical protein
MRYLTLAADYMQSALRDQHTGTVTPEEAGLPENLSDLICDWNARYQPVISLDMENRREVATSAMIDSLDREGLMLAEKIANSGVGLKIRYYSEGRLRYLS